MYFPLRCYVLCLLSCLISFALLSPMAFADEAARARDIARDIHQLEQEARAHGGWDVWNAQLEGFRAEALERLNIANAVGPDNIVLGNDGFLFLLYGRAYLTGASLSFRTAGSGETRLAPSLQELISLSMQLKARGIDLLFVPVPSRQEVYPDALVDEVPADGVVLPERKRMILELLKSDVEAIDLLPALLELRETSSNVIYHRRDTHWATSSIQVSAKLIAERLQRYDFAPRTVDGSNGYTTQEILYKPPFTILTLPAGKDTKATGPVSWKITQVVGSPGPISNDSPILVVGDSLIYVMSDLQAGFAHHVARFVGRPVAMDARVGGGPDIPKVIARQGREGLAKRRVIVWVMNTSFLFPGSDKRWQAVTLP